MEVEAKSQPVRTEDAPKNNNDDPMDDDAPLSTLKKKSTPAKRQIVEDDDDDLPLSTLKKPAITPDASKKSGASKAPNGIKEEKDAPAKKTPSQPAKKPSTPAKSGTPSKDTKATPKAAVKKETPAKSAPAKSTPAKSPSKTAPVKRPREDNGKSKATPKKKVKKEDSSSDSSSSDSDSSSSDSSDSDSSSSDSDSSSSSSSSDSEDDVPLKKRKEAAKKATPKKSPAKKSPAKKATPKKGDVKKETPKKKPKKEDSSPAKKKAKKEDDAGTPKKGGRVKKEEEPVFKWWKAPPLPENKKWQTLEHNGVLFPPPYKPHNIQMRYNEKPIELGPRAEEIATYFAQHLETDHMKKPQFKKNFFTDFRKILKKEDKELYEKIKDIDKCDFRPIHKYLMEQKDERKNRSKEEKDKEKAERAKEQEIYGTAIVDGYKQKIGNFRIEPPGLFLGRGDHPLAGKLKKRVEPEDVTINIGPDAKVPKCPVEGRHWGHVQHDDEVAWLAMYKDINDNFKYVWLSASSRVKGEADMKKFEKARKLKSHIGEIRDTYNSQLKAKDIAVRQRATAVYVIDHLALRVGNEKGEDEADTVGCCSLRVEHIKLVEPNQIEFDFLGKDSMRYQNKVTVDKTVFKNFQKFTEGKKEKDDVFDQLSTSALNKYLGQQMEGLTAKVFRTYNASITLEKELQKMDDIEGADKWTVDEKMLAYNRANRDVAILCNHQRSVSKTFGEQMGKIDEKIDEHNAEIKKLKEALRDVKAGRKVRQEYSSEEEEEGKEKKKRKFPDTEEKIDKRIISLKASIKKLETKKTEKDDLKEVSLTTSKINYIDPRISVAWAKKWDVPIEKIFSKTLREKFPWAMDVDEFEF
eukprot:TRINITY_DN2698_c0_g1_i2.p1 TRINITY_DN2698_c0_g1~~TRINITY_DN2698_c0_g1_i2.p1  ORF type:complete len:906 (-),score=334.78 TRINITY_DN2698_c0_g1_i2:19-2598(-)